ncbi:MAG TPA: enolase C-terminal domain-like protein [Devosiaceae bacterium]|jgi:L-alanine-DL-glutamate epimerase-like enolase superfamily enzyme|nr:enolase C-terminal domain-like protein [Devosiaceae bacterium]
MRIDGYELRTYRLPYKRPVRWFNSSETAGEFIALRLMADGARGVAELPLKPTWAGLSPRAVVALVEDLYLPALAQVDIADWFAVRTALLSFPGNHVAKMLVVNACATLGACAAGQPIWSRAGGNREVELSWCVTRQTPGEMAAEAEAMVARHGFRTLKVKGGQGLETDRAALRAIRSAVGPNLVLTVDANGAYPMTQALGYVGFLAEEGVAVAEDPAPLIPGAALTGLIAAAALPILIDSPCVTAADAREYIAAGARALSVKPGRVGFAECAAIADLAAGEGVSLCSGLYAESALGSLIALQQAGSIPSPLVPAEQSFFLLMTSQILQESLDVKEGRLRLPSAADLDAMANWTLSDRIGGR